MEGGSAKPPGAGEPKPKYDPDIRKTLVDAIYRRDVDAAEAARRRAQAAWVIVSAIAAAVLAAGALANLEQESQAIRVLGLTALGMWLAAAGLFLLAVAAPYRGFQPESIRGTGEFIKYALESPAAERKQIERRQMWAQGASALAVVITMTVVGLLLFTGRPQKTEVASLHLTPVARQDLSAVCAQQVPAVVTGEIDTGSVSGRSVSVKLPAGECGAEATTAVVDEDALVYPRPPP